MCIKYTTPLHVTTLQLISVYYLLWFGCGQQQKHQAAAPSPPPRVRRRMERNRQKLVGWDKDSLIEQQRKGTGTTTIQIRSKDNTNHRTEPLSPGPPPRAPEL